MFFHFFLRLLEGKSTDFMLKVSACGKSKVSGGRPRAPEGKKMNGLVRKRAKAIQKLLFLWGESDFLKWAAKFIQDCFFWSRISSTNGLVNLFAFFGVPFFHVLPDPNCRCRNLTWHLGESPELGLRKPTELYVRSSLCLPAQVRCATWKVENINLALLTLDDLFIHVIIPLALLF